MRGKTPTSKRAWSRRTRGFNEAPAECGGKREAHVLRDDVEAASMRPPQNAGENGSYTSGGDWAGVLQ